MDLNLSDLEWMITCTAATSVLVLSNCPPHTNAKRSPHWHSEYKDGSHAPAMRGEILAVAVVE